MSGRAGHGGKGGVRTRAPDPWTGKGGFTTLDKDQRVVWEPGLPAMVTARRQHNTRKSSDHPAEDAPVVCDLKNTLKLSADAKVEWLEKVLKSISKGQAKAQEVYDIVAHPRFVSGISERAGQKILRMVTDSILVFSEKQRDAFSKSKLFREFAMQQTQQRRADSSDEEPAKGRRSRSCSRSRSASSSEARPARRRSPSPKAPQKLQKDRRPTASPQSDSAHERSSGDLADGADPKALEEKVRMEQALKEQEQKREEERKKAEAERKAQLEREQKRKAKLGSAFLVGNEEEEDGPPQMPVVSYEKRRLEGSREEKPLAMEYAVRAPPAASSSSAPPEAARFVESMGGGSILQEAHRMLLQKACADSCLQLPYWADPNPHVALGR